MCLTSRPSLPGGPRCREALVTGRPSLPVVGGPCRETLAGRPLPGDPCREALAGSLCPLLRDPSFSFIEKDHLRRPYGEG